MLYRIDIEIELDGAFNHYHNYNDCGFEFDSDKLIIKLGGDSDHEIIYDYRVIKYLRIDEEDES